MNLHSRSFAFFHWQVLKRFLAIKHQLEVSRTFVRSTVSTAICTITVQHSLDPTSLSGVSRCLAVTVLTAIMAVRAPGFHVPYK
jgi:hypothetical protein